MDITKLPQLPEGYSWDWYYFQEKDDFVVYLKRPGKVSVRFHESGYWQTTNGGVFGKRASQELAIEDFLKEELNG